MSWPPEGSKPPVPPRPAPAVPPRPERPSPKPSPGETTGETKVKPQASTTGPQPPQFGHDGIDPLRALLILGLPLLAVAITLLVLFASPLVWWIAAGVAAAAVTGGVVLRRSRRARGLLRRLPGAGRAASALRRTSNGRFARSPLGRAFGRALGRRPAGTSSGRSGGRSKTRGGKLRSLLPAWVGGTRGKHAGGSGGASSGGRPGGRMRSLLGRLKPGGGRRPGSTGGASGGRPGKPGGASPSGSKTKPGSLLRRAKKASRTVGAKLLGCRPSASSGGRGGSSKPNGKGKGKPPGGDSGVADAAHKKAGGLGRLVGEVAEAITEPTVGMTKDGYGVIKVRGNRELTRPGTGPSWPAEDPDEVKPGKPKPGPLPPVRTTLDPAWPTEDPDEVKPSQPPKQSLPTERDHDPPPSRTVSPPPHREAPLVTSANTRHGGTMQSANTYVQMIDNSTPSTYASTCREAADQARRDSAEKEEEAKKLRREADDFDALTGAGNKAAAQKLRAEAANCEQDAKNRLTWASRLDGMANESDAKIAS